MTGVPDKCDRCPYKNERFGLTLAAKEDDVLRLQAEEHGSLYADPGSCGGGERLGRLPSWCCVGSVVRPTPALQTSGLQNREAVRFSFLSHSLLYFVMQP